MRFFRLRTLTGLEKWLLWIFIVLVTYVVIGIAVQAFRGGFATTPMP